MATATWNDESSRGKRNRRKKWLWRLLLSLYYVYITNKFAHCLKISRNVSFFSNIKIIFDFQIFEFFKRFKTCYIFYDFNTLCSGSSSTGIMRFAFKLVGGTALVFPGFQLWGAKLENPFFFLDCPLPKFISLGTKKWQTSLSRVLFLLL